MNRFLSILLLSLLMICGLSAYAINTSEDIDKTILNLYDELQFDQKLADEEIGILQKSREEYWEHIVDLQKEADKAALALYSQDGGSLFCVGLASEALSNVCSSFDKEKVPFENWLQAMNALTSRYNRIRKALNQIHTEHLPSETLGYINKSVSICDSMDAKFANMRDSIALDQKRYEKLTAEVRQLEGINRTVADQIRAQIFQNNKEDFISVFFNFNYSDMDLFYDFKSKNLEYSSGEDLVSKKQKKWDRIIFLIALASSLIFGIALSFVKFKNNQYREKRWYYALLLFIGILILGIYILSGALGLNDYMRHILDICNEGYFFIFWMVLAAILRLRRPGIGWSIAACAPLFLLDIMLIDLAVSLLRNQALKTVMPVVCIFIAIVALVILVMGAKRFLKSDYPVVFSCLGLVFLATVLVLIGYYYPSFMLVVFSVSLMTYTAAFVCFKCLFAKRIEKRSPVLHLTLTHLIYPLYFIFALMQSLEEVANVFNLHTWLTELMDTPFFDLPQYGIISVSRVILLIVIGIIVNYIIKLVKLILMRIDKNKYETGAHAVAITLGTMIVWFGYAIVALVVLQINHGGVIAAIGGASLGIGFAMKETFENLISGLQLMASRARPGDLVECEGARGVIRHIGILSTQIEVEDGPIVSLPNRQLLGSTFTNLSLNQRREVRHIVFDISADSDLELAKDLMLEASRDIEGVVDHDKHYVVMRNTNSGIVRLDYKCWIDSSKYLHAEPEVREAIFKAFRENGIQIADFSNELGFRLTGTVVGK